MKRRQFVRGTTLALFAGTAGCLNRTAPGGSDERSPSQTTTQPNETTTPGETTTPPSEGASATDFTVLDQGCGTTTHDASIDFESDGSRVVVTGRVPGSDTCRTATLESASYDAETDEFDVVVATTDRTDEDETKACGECIVSIEYEATFDFDGDLPSTVTVTHAGYDGEREVASAAHGRSAAGSQ